MARATHIYPTRGTYTISPKARDVDGTHAGNTLEITVREAEVTVTMELPPGWRMVSIFIFFIYNKYCFYDLYVIYINSMKTTIEISDSLFKEAKKMASEKGTTLKDIIESSLRNMLNSQKKKEKHFRLRKHSFHGNGLQPGLHEGDWPKIRKYIYEDQEEG